MRFRLILIAIFVVVATISGCERNPLPEDSRTHTDRKLPVSESTNFHIKDQWSVEDFSIELDQFETVFWDSADTESLRHLIRTTPLVKNKIVLEIGTGTGLISLCCLKHGAKKVVATDINPAAIANAKHNAQRLELDGLETRQVALEQPGAFSVVDPGEQFDLIISNPPWEDQAPQSIDEFALYDEDFDLMRSLVKGLPEHLSADGKALLAYGNVEAIQTLIKLARQHDLEIEVLDDRNLADLPENFLPGMLLEIRRPRASQDD